MMRCGWTLAAAWIVLILPVRGDTIVFNDGRRMNGEVTETADGYVIKSKGMQITVQQHRVAQWIKEDAGKSPASAVPAVVEAQPATRPSVDLPSVPQTQRANRTELVAFRMRIAEEALAAGELVPARSRFLDVLDAEPNNVRALQGLALAQAGLGQREAAAATIDRALARASANNTLDRALMANFGIVQIAARYPMRAAKFVSEYLATHQEPLDVTLIDIWAVALGNADRQTRGGTLYRQLAVEYGDFNVRLEAQRPYQRRWGIEWLPEAQFQQRSSTWQQALRRVEAAQQRVASADAGVRAARQQMAAARSRIFSNNGNMSQINSASRAVGNAKENYDSACIALEDAETAAEGMGPSFPRRLVTLSMDEVEPPVFGFNVASSVTPSRVAAPAEMTVARVPDIGNLSNPDPLKSGPTGRPEPIAAPAVVIPKQPRARSITRVACAVPVAPDLLLTSAEAVRGAKSIRLESLQGHSFAASIVSTDEASGLALIRATGQKLGYARVGDRVPMNGAVACVSFAPSLFDIRTEAITGRLKVEQDRTTLSLPRLPRHVGSPLVSENIVVGLVLSERGGDPGAVRIATATQIREFCGAHLLDGVATYYLPEQIICELIATADVD